MAEANAEKPFHFVADLVKHPPNLAIHSLLKDDAQPCRAELLHAGELRPFAIEKNPGAQLFRKDAIVIVTGAELFAVRVDFALDARCAHPRCVSVRRIALPFA